MNNLQVYIWLNSQALEAAKFYETVLSAKILSINYYPKGSPGDADGKPMIVAVKIKGVDFVFLNGFSDQFAPNPSVSFVLNCKTQDEIDAYWNAFLIGGNEMQCGWITDKFGITWQVVPENISNYIANPDPEKSAKAMQAMMKMKKMIIADFEQAISQ